METTKIKLLISVFAILGFIQTGCAQSKIDYSIKSNILNPDTLKGDQKLVFDHFVKWTHKQMKELKSSKLKIELGKLDIKTTNKERFQNVYFFLRSDMTYHKKSIEQWESFKDLDPGYKKTK